MTEKHKRPLVPALRFPDFQDAAPWKHLELADLSKLVIERVGATTCTPYTITSGIGLISQEEKLGRTIAGNSLKNYIVLQRNDFAYNKSATKAYPQGFIARYAGDDRAAVPNSIFTCFRVDQNLVVPAFLDELFSSNLHGKWLRNRIAVGARAHGSLQVNNDDLMAIPVPLPNGSRSIAEQQKIADCLSSLDDLIAAETQKLDAFKTHKKGLMQQLFPREGETAPRLRFPEFLEVGDWETTKLGIICNMQSGKFVSASEISESREEGFSPCYGGNGLRGYTKTFNQSGQYSLIGRQGALCGNVNFVNGDFYATEHAVVTTPKLGIRTGWLFYNLCFLDLNRFSTGQAQPGLSVEVLEKVDCMVPKDEKEQDKIADCLSSIDELIAAETRKLDTLKLQKKGLIKQLFPTLVELST